jgi:ferredoxin
VGQASTIAISGISGFYISNNSNQSVASAIISGANVAISALAAGTTNITVCQSGGQCAALYVTVSGGTIASNGSIVISQMLSVGQSVNLSISGGSGSYYLSSNTGNIFGAVISGNTLTLTGIGAGLSSINVCSSDGSCIPVYVSVSGSSNSGTATSQTASAITSQIQALQNQITQIQSGSTATGSYKFQNPIKLGDKNSDVTELQKRLTSEGVYSGPITGLYGPLTEAAVKKYQTRHNLTPLGSVGPGTRAALNQ